MKPGGIADTGSAMVRDRGLVCEDLRSTTASRAYWRVWTETDSRGLADFAAEAAFNQIGEE